MKGRVLNIRPVSSPRLIAMSGTPVSENPDTCFPVLRLLIPERVPSRTRFDNHFVVRSATQAGPITINKAVAYRNLNELKQLLESVSVRRLKSEIRGMPDRLEVVRYCQPTPTQSGHYRECLKGLLADFANDPSWADTLDLACVRLLRLRQCLNHPGVLGLDGDSGKYLELDEIVEEVLSEPGPYGGKLLIWTEWNKAVDLLARRYDSWGVIKVDQRTTQEQLAKHERMFDSSDDRIVIATPAKGGTGLDWLSRARTAVYLEKCPSLVNFKQSIDRIVRRVGDDASSDTPEARQIKAIKRSSATIIYLHVQNSVDDAIDHILKTKLDLGDALLVSDHKLLQDGRADLLQILRAGMRL